MALLFIISFSLLLSFVFFNLSSSYLNTLVILEKSNPDIIVTQVTQVTLVTQVTVVTLVTLVTQVTLITQVTLVTQVTLITQVTLVTLITLVTHPSHRISQLSHPSQSK